MRRDDVTHRRRVLIGGLGKTMEGGTVRDKTKRTWLNFVDGSMNRHVEHGGFMVDEADGEMRGYEEQREEIHATCATIDRFNERLSAIRTQLHERHKHGVKSLPVLPSTQWTRDQGEPASRIEEVYSQVKLPVLASTAHLHGQPNQEYLSPRAVEERARQQEQYVSDHERVNRAEEQAAAAIQNAERLAEEARIAMVVYTQSEKSWNFDERAKRYQQVMQANKVAEAAKMQADDECVYARTLRAQLVNPYESMRSSQPKRVTTSLTLESLSVATDFADHVLVWILAAPLLTLPFTPRDRTTQLVLDPEKELSTHVVYYAAASSQSPMSLQSEDHPPLDGWQCCSSHGVDPAPTLTPVKSSLETWLIAGAGAAFVNGRYVCSGVHNRTKKFKSSSGIELFRKCLPRSSSIVQGLGDIDDSEQAQLDPQTSIPREASPTAKVDELPRTLRSLETDVSDFKSMKRIGTWMRVNEITQKRQRQRDADTVQSALHSPRRDGDHVTNQDKNFQRKGTEDVAASRPEASADICKEWVLLMHCSRRLDQPKRESSQPPRSIGLGCLKRHYYISVEEKQAMVTWAQEHESWLVKDALAGVIRRETSLEKVRRMCQECNTLFQENLVEETQQTLDKIIDELNHLRFLTVKVLEMIETWRAHARKLGFALYHESKVISDRSSETNGSGEPPILGWSASITVSTGRQLYKGSKAFVSKFKRFCRPEDAKGQKERKLVYLGYFPTKDEAEQAYDKFAAAEARRLNTTVSHLPRRRNVFRSCGKHFAVESERVGPDYCIECKIKQLSSTVSADEWNPPFHFVPGENYILKMANDLDFLDTILPLKMLLNSSASGSAHEPFPLLGNVFLLPKTPIQDPSLVTLCTLGGTRIPPLKRTTKTNNQMENVGNQEVVDEALDSDRVLNVQRLFLQELQIYHPELFKDMKNTDDNQQPEEYHQSLKGVEATPRIVQALYWDRCAALRIQQERLPLAYRIPGIWCRPDEGEWASLIVRGKHQQHFVFELNLVKAGRELQEKRRKALSMIRKLLKTPLYFIPSRDVILQAIFEGEQVKGDVVMLEVKSTQKYLEKYDRWCIKSIVVQRWYRGVRGRIRARAKRKALALTCRLRLIYAKQVSQTALETYTHRILPKAMRCAIKQMQVPVFSQATRLDDELVVIAIHASRAKKTLQYSSLYKQPRCIPCHSCARRFRVRVQYNSHVTGFRLFAGTCACKLNNPGDEETEEWVVRAYSPISNTIHRLRMGNSLLHQLLGADKTAPWLWNPVFERDTADRVAKTATNMTNSAHRLRANEHQNMMSWRLLSDDATQRRKSAEVELERTTKRVQELEKRYECAINDTRRALAFTSRQFHEAQAWDPLENANDWRLIVGKRQTEKLLSSEEAWKEKCRFELFQAVSDESFLCVQAAAAHAEYETYWLPQALREEDALAKASVELETKQTSLKDAIHRLCNSLLTIRDAHLAPTRRSLVLQPPAWRMEPLMIAIPGLHRGRNVLRRRAILLSDRNCERNRQCRKRMMVEVSAWTYSSDANIKRNLWVTAYDPVICQSHRLYLDWDLVNLLITSRGSKEHPLPARGRGRFLAVADKLLALAMLDQFTTEFTLHKLQFYHILRLLRPRVHNSRWFHDLRRGRKSGDGDEILRQGVLIDGKSCFVIVFENWGDLVIIAYRAGSSQSHRVELTIRGIFDLLDRKPTMLQLWISCVKANNYVPTLLLYILKQLRWTSDVSAICVRNSIGMIESIRTRRVRFRSASFIQGRRVLITIRSDDDGDFEINVYDWTLNATYQLTLEWETVQRVLKTSNEQRHTRRQRNLLLARNQRALCEWISSRLCFQRLLEHPDVLASANSPIITGLSLRQSYQELDDWIRTSVRNPINGLSREEVDRNVASLDTDVFQSLQYEQLVFRSQERMSFGEGKKLLATRDFSPHESDHLRIDFFLKTHSLFARVRHEITQEAATRRENEESVKLEKEEQLSLQRELRDLLHEVKIRLQVASRTNVLLSRVWGERAESWQSVHAQIRERLCTETTSVDKVLESNGPCRDGDSQVNDCLFSIPAATSALLDSLSLGEENALVALRSTFGGLIVGIDSNSRFTEISSHLEGLLRAFEQSLVASDAYGSSVQNKRLRLERFAQTFDVRLLSDSNDSSSSITIGSDDETQETHPEEEALANESNDSVLGLIVRFDPITMSDEEFCVANDSASTRSFTEITPTLIQSAGIVLFRPSRRSTIRGNSTLTVKRVRHGVLIYQADPRAQWNPRASAIAKIMIRGDAVFIPWPPSTCTFPLDLKNATSTYATLSSQAAAMNSKVRPVQGRRATAQRTKQLLPWKQFSIERLKIVRKAKLQRMLDRLAVDTLNDEREKAAITDTAILRRSLEWMYGAVKPSVLSLDSIVASLVLHRATDGSKARIEVKDHLVLRNLFSREQETSLVPSDITNELRLEHLQLEIDDLEDPRRLIISCRELQSQQRYFVDCSLHELSSLTSRVIEKCWPRPRISVQEWRDLAACAALKIRFDQRNGQMSLVFDESIECSDNTTTTVEATDEADVNPAVEELNATVKIDVDPPQPVSDQVVEVRNAVACCRARRFRKHQAAIRQLAAIHLRVERLKDYELRQLPQEWKQMTLEDWVSEEARGVLLLDEKVLKQLKGAFTSRTRFGLNGEAQEQAMHLLRHLAKEMLGASHELTQEAMLDHLQAVSQAVWWRRKHPISNPELDFFDVAEWWRRIISEKAQQNTATKNVKR